MKIAISVPEPVFRAAEKVARQQKKSRSQLYADAVAAYVAHHGDDGIREQLDALYEQSPSAVEPGLAAVQTRILPDETW
ncbi:MAG: hypothetical protein C0434_10705 [Xanthomonadaceae bacterium]|nr:hypothetical protein [Xanthomonadaceae bacterium]